MRGTFLYDKQTMDDLNLQGKFQGNTIFSLFNQTVTAGGERVLDTMFRTPLSREQEINTRSGIFHFFQQAAMPFPLENELVKAFEQYLSFAVPGLFSSMVQVTRRKALAVMGLREEHQLMLKGLDAAIRLLNTMQTFIHRLLKEHPASPLDSRFREVAAIFADTRLQWLSAADSAATLGYGKLVRYEYLLKQVLRKQMEQLLHFVYDLDVYIAVATVAATRGFTYATAQASGDNMLTIAEGYHPSIEKAIPNTVTLSGSSNIIFLTGANMAGKSTYMKTVGVLVYLAHMGFPVSAAAMTFSVMEGIYTSINVPDNIDMGYSHFYAEVLRVKNIAAEISAPHNLVVIFDELFKGTNVKDAYDATLAVTEALAAHRNCFFIVSTHIVEVGAALQQQFNNIQFLYMPTVIENGRPVYPYRSQEGISADRHGMTIIRNEGILELL
ncbi:MutS domain III [Chitinophaga costaii]|uniref:MutS domain III n=1 Tax=Chitinophaga costaii TaxID=1335309 RepID=A0A1C4E1I6_9BACT|nr:hypothetical protein [Chitinophaga costaii]PUZ24377.1 DNA mismatch repair protein [Chitinophaga costaii]SCC37371.1 MutS domain III [Chitinophaga costaii]